MRKFACLTALLVAAVALGATGLAGADESVQTEEATVKPGKLPAKGKRNVKLINTITTFDDPTSQIQQPKSARRTVLDLPKQIKVNNKSVRYCKTDVAGLQQAPTVKDAKRVCGKKSQVSIDAGSSATVTVGAQAGATMIPVDVVAFNERGKKLLLYSKPKGAYAGIAASILVGKLKKFDKVKGRPPGTDKGPYRQSLDVTVPPLSAGAISFFEVTVKKGRYLQAKCKPKRMKFQATTFFTDGSKTSDTDVHKCKPKKGKKRGKR